MGISVSVAQIKKIKKTRSIYFLILLLAGLSSPSQLVPNPFNWSPKVFLTDIPVSVAKIKKIKNSKNNIHLFLNVASRKTFLTQSIGPQPIKLVPNPFNWSPKVFHTDISVLVAKIKKK